MGKGEFADPGMAIGNGVDVLCPREVGFRCFSILAFGLLPGVPGTRHVLSTPCFL